MATRRRKKGVNYQLASRSNFSYFLVQLPSSLPLSSLPWRRRRRNVPVEKESGHPLRCSSSIFLHPFVLSLLWTWLEGVDRTIVLEELRGNKRLSINFLTNPFWREGNTRETLDSRQFSFEHPPSLPSHRHQQSFFLSRETLFHRYPTKASMLSKRNRAGREINRISKRDYHLRPSSILDEVVHREPFFPFARTDNYSCAVTFVGGVSFFFNPLHFVPPSSTSTLFFRDKWADHGSTSVNFTSWPRERDSFYEIIFCPKGEEGEGKGPVSRVVVWQTCVIIIKWDDDASLATTFVSSKSFTRFVYNGKLGKRDLDIGSPFVPFPGGERMEAIKEREAFHRHHLLFLLLPKKKILIMTNPLLALVQYLNE